MISRESNPLTILKTLDVDAILPAKDMAAIERNDDFWQAQEKTNNKLQSAGLYFTHLFEEKQVILSANWLQHIVTLDVWPFKKLSLKRPSTHDLALTKMMRVDPEDREDILFLVRQKDWDSIKFVQCLDQVRCPPVLEIEEAFAENKLWLKEQAII